MNEHPETQLTDSFNHEQVWADVEMMIKHQAQLIQKLMVCQFKLAYEITKHQLMKSAGYSTQDTPYNKASLDRGLQNITQQKAELGVCFAEDLAKIQALRDKYKEHPRSLLILEAADRQINQLSAYAQGHQPNSATLTRQINEVSDISHVVTTPTANRQTSTSAR